MFSLQTTDDGSLTFFSSEYQEMFHSHSGAKQEAQSKFVEPCQLSEKVRVKTSFKILDICYGLGYNSAAALDTIWSFNPQAQVEIVALENDATVPRQAVAQQLLNAWTVPIPQALGQLAQTHRVQTPQLNAKLYLGDARQTIKTVIQAGFQADAIFLDPFSPPKCPQLWTVEFLTLVAQCLHKDGRLATYSCAASVRVALQLAGLNIARTANVGRRSPGTLASFSRLDSSCLSQQECEHLQTRAAVPYRDSTLQDSTATIYQRRQVEQKASSLETTSQWKKRWQE